MSEADGPAKDIKPATPASRTDCNASPTLDANATFDTSGSAAYGAERTIPERKSIGSYRLIQKLGEGGMGQVWLAEQTAPLRRQVALKFIRAGMYNEALLQRFQSERQSLAIMEHPAIAKVFDAGATSDGQPYFVMEYVPGVRITDYCDQKRLKICERLELFIQVCEGVQHAHQKAIIHRDLKPANILVVEVDGKPMPRIIDFGLAKMTGPQIAGETMFTQMGALVGTPGYMSPEQADVTIGDVDTRTDVYSLGAVLYVLLTGFLPFDTKQWQKQPLCEVLRQLREDDPPRPSTKLGQEKESSATSAEARGVLPKQLVSLLHGDLDWITMKALEKDRARRYGAPSELAADITRYLRHEPVVARPASTGYRLQKYVRRHRIAAAAAASLVVLLVAFAAMQGVQLRRITRERDRANRITDFMTNMFKVSDPSEARGKSITAREILDKASKDIETGLAKDPELQSQMMQVMGDVYANLGLYPRAESLLTRALDIRRRVLGPRNRDTLRSMHGVAWILQQQGHYVDAERLQRETLDIRRRVLGPDDPGTLATMGNLGFTLLREGRLTEAEKVLRQTLETQRRVLGPDHRDTLRTRDSVGWTLFREGRYVEAEKLQRETLDIQRRVLGPDDLQTLDSMTTLAATEANEGHPAEAEKLFREALDIRRNVLGPEHMFTLATMNNLAVVLGREAHYADAEKLYRETLDIQQRVLGPEHPNTLDTMENLGDTLMKMGRYAESEKLFHQTRNIQRRVLGSEHPLTALSTYNLGCIAALRGHREKALSLLQEAVDHGLGPIDELSMDKDPNLKSLRGDPHFDALVAHAKERAAAAQKPQ